MIENAIERARSGSVAWTEVWHRNDDGSLSIEHVVSVLGEDQLVMYCSHDNEIAAQDKFRELTR